MAAIGLLILAGAGLYLNRRFDDVFHRQEDPLGEAPLQYDSLPFWHQDDLQEKTFVGQQNTTVRAPFGPNPDTHYANAPELFFNEPYKWDYLQNQFELRVENQDWRLDPVFSSELVNASKPISPIGLQMSLNYMRRKSNV